MKKNTDKLIEGLKNDYSKNGMINNSYITTLNNNGWSFEQIRDLLKEMDV